MTDPIDAKMAAIMARVAQRKAECPACEAYEERAAVMEFDAGLSRPEAERQARLAHPCDTHKATGTLGGQTCVPVTGGSGGIGVPARLAGY